MPKSTTTHVSLTRSYAATELTSRSAPTSCGLSIRIGIPVRIVGPTTSIRGRGSGSPSRVHCSDSCGTVEDTIERPCPRTTCRAAPSRFASAAPSSSPVDSRTVANRQCSATRARRRRDTPKCVWVLPTSTTSSIARNYGLATARAAGRLPGPPARARAPPARRPASRPPGSVSPGSSSSSGTSTNRREVTSACGRVRRSEHVLELVQQQQVDVDHPRPVADAAGGAADVALDLLAGIEQLLGVERGLDPQAGVEEVGLVEHQADRLGLVHRGGGEHRDPVPGSAATAA